MKLLSITALILATALFMGCSSTQDQNSSTKKGTQKQQNQLPESDVSTDAVALSDLLGQSETYAGTDIVVSGTFSGICCATDFVLKDGFDAIEVYTSEQCPMPPESKINSKVQVHGTVQVRGDEVSLVAKEVTFE